MTQPSPQRIEVALTAMRSESSLWTDISQRLDDVLPTISSMSMHGTGWTFVFEAFVSAHEQAVREYIRLCADGRNQTGEIGLTLIRVARLYATEEAANLHAQQRLY